MAMYPNATHGYMPFVKPAHKRQAAKRSKADKDSLKTKAAEGTKTYKVTMRDRRGFTYTYIIQADASAKNVPVLCESRVTAPDSSSSPLLSNSLPNMRRSARFPVAAPETRSCASLAEGKEDLTKVGSEKKGLFNSLLQFIKKRTTSKAPTPKTLTPGPKSKRKLKPLPQRKRQRTVSAMSHLGTIQESPEEDNLELEDTDSYSHDSVTSGNESESGDGQGSCPP